MTKEELESKFEDCFDANTRPSEGGYGPDVTDKVGLWRSLEPIIAEWTADKAISFMDWALDSDKIVGDNWGDGFIPHPETSQSVYNQFIEQQNKDNGSR